MDFNLERFVVQHEVLYNTALREIKNGKKEEHWMWYIFPQLRGLGRRQRSYEYGIESLDEAVAFLQHPYLGSNLREITGELLKLETDNVYDVFEDPDVKKLCSCMTLFSYASADNADFLAVIDKFFKGRKDRLTCEMLGV
ncbi:MAG: DUF1810 domain-containing protein [Clostridia bacterium]|nr:DUF1810 domain-containing protein [Clostridia bacterium]